MNLMMNPSLATEIAAQRRDALIVAADQHRTRRLFRAAKSARHESRAPNVRRVLQFVASVSPAGADVAGTTTSANEFEHACGRVA